MVFLKQSFLLGSEAGLESSRWHKEEKPESLWSGSLYFNNEEIK